MANTEPASVWQKVLDELEQDLSQQQFNSWFQSIQIRTMGDDLVVLRVPNDFARDWLNENYRRHIQAAFQTVTGVLPSVELEVDPTLVLSPPPINGQGGVIGESAAEAAESPAGSGLFSEVHLNETYTFDRFVVGPSNRIPHAASVAVAENPARAYNPLFLHGMVGLGKTHLLQAVCHELLDKRPQMRILYLSCESFVNHFIASIQRGELADFRYRYRHIDALIIDDIHFLANKEQTQEEFFHTFNTLYQSGKQIVLSSDSPPLEIPTLEERLVSRFKMGLVTKVEAPVFETRLAILRQKSRDLHLEFDDDTLGYIAERIDTNIRELEGAINILSVEARSRGLRRIDLDLARSALRDFLPSQAPVATMSRIIDAVVEDYGVKYKDLQSRSRAKSIAFPRQVAMYLAKKLTKHSLEEIGSHFGGRDHSTVIYAVDKISKKLDSDVELASTVSRLMRRIEKGA